MYNISYYLVIQVFFRYYSDLIDFSDLRADNNLGAVKSVFWFFASSALLQIMFEPYLKSVVYDLLMGNRI